MAAAVVIASVPPPSSGAENTILPKTSSCAISVSPDSSAITGNELSAEFRVLIIIFFRDKLLISKFISELLF